MDLAILPDIGNEIHSVSTISMDSSLEGLFLCKILANLLFIIRATYLYLFRHLLHQAVRQKQSFYAWEWCPLSRGISATAIFAVGVCICRFHSFTVHCSQAAGVWL